jgi:hypothetical protein
MPETHIPPPPPLPGSQDAKIAMIRKHIADRIAQNADNMVGWREPDGHLLPTEPDPEERKAIRIQLMAATQVLKELDNHILVVTGGR